MIKWSEIDWDDPDLAFVVGLVLIGILILFAGLWWWL